MFRISLTTGLLLACVSILVPEVRAEKNWPSWRGPHGDGHAHEEGLPTSWSNSDVTWKTPLPGQGQSSPVIWEDRIFLTAAKDSGRERLVFCVDRNTGEILWLQTAWTATPQRPPEPTHKMNGWASATCATDGKHVFAFFGRGGGLSCYTVHGVPVWSKDLGVFEGPWGTAACPVLFGDTVIQNCDSDSDAYLIALDKETGEQVWKTPREDFRCWSTPVLIKVDGHDELVLQGHTGVRGYDPATGKELWSVKGYNGRGSPTVTPGNGLLYVVNGRPGPIYSIKPGGTGDATATHKKWATNRGGGRDLPSPVVIGKYVLVMNMKGVLSCYHGDTGEELWRGRIGGNFSSSPIAWDGLAFLTSESGETVVVKPKDELEVVTRNRIEADDDEIFRASLTPSDGQIFLRSDRVLYCIGKRKPSEN